MTALAKRIGDLLAAQIEGSRMVRGVKMSQDQNIHYGCAAAGFVASRRVEARLSDTVTPIRRSTGAGDIRYLRTASTLPREELFL